MVGLSPSVLTPSGLHLPKLTKGIDHIVLDMIFLPSSRRHLLSVITILALIIIWRSRSSVPNSISSFVIHRPPPPPTGSRVPIASLKHHVLPLLNTSSNHLSPPSHYYYTWGKQSHDEPFNGSILDSAWSPPILNPHLEVLWQCPMRANKFTNHIRLPNIVQNISQIPPKSVKHETRIFWNPTIIALPYWSTNQYLIVSRIVTDGNHQENVLCEANPCYVGSGEDARKGELACTEEDLRYVGPAGGLRCVGPPERLSVPPTPAAHCEGKFGSYTDIPGFHDPRIFYSGKGEPLMMVNTQ